MKFKSMYRRFLPLFQFIGGALCLASANVMFAQTAGGSGSAPTNSLGAIAENVTGSFGAFAQLITAGSFVAGSAFMLAALFKFKAHKDNPQSAPIGTPIALLFIGAAMIFLPLIFSSAGATLFGSQASSQNATGGPSGVIFTPGGQ